MVVNSFCEDLGNSQAVPWGTIEISNRASNRVKGDAPEQSHQQPNKTLRRLVGVPFNTGSEHQWELQESLIVFARLFQCGLKEVRTVYNEEASELQKAANVDCLSEKRRMP